MESKRLVVVVFVVNPVGIDTVLGNTGVTTRHTRGRGAILNRRSYRKEFIV